MGFSLTTLLALPSARSHASPKTHTPLPRLQERGHRFYSTELSRWISRDPIGERVGLNLHAYVRNGAPNWIDPLGLYDETITCTDRGRPDIEIKLGYENCSEKRRDEIGDLMCKSLYGYIDAVAASTAASAHTQPCAIKCFKGVTGNLGATEWATPTENLAKIVNKMKKGRTLFECKDCCEKDESDIVTDRWWWNEITICPSFWKLGQKTKCGALDHELAHYWAGVSDVGGYWVEANNRYEKPPPGGTGPWVPTNPTTGQLGDTADAYACYVGCVISGP